MNLGSASPKFSQVLFNNCGASPTAFSAPLRTINQSAKLLLDRAKSQQLNPFQEKLILLAGYYIRDSELIRETLVRTTDELTQKYLRTHTDDLTERITDIERATDPNSSLGKVSAKKLRKWKYDDDLRLAMGMPISDYQKTRTLIDELLLDLPA